MSDSNNRDEDRLRPTTDLGGVSFDGQMSGRVFTGHGIEIFRDGDRFSIRYDAGEIVVDYREIEVSRAEAIKAMRSERDAYDVLIGHTP